KIKKIFLQNKLLYYANSDRVQVINVNSGKVIQSLIIDQNLQRSNPIFMDDQEIYWYLSNKIITKKIWNWDYPKQIYDVQSTTILKFFTKIRENIFVAEVNNNVLMIFGLNKKMYFKIPNAHDGACID